MKSISLILSILISYATVLGQDFAPKTIKSETRFLENGNQVKEQRNSTVEFLINKKSKKNEIKLTIDRIMRNVKLSHVESFDTDTARYEGETFSVDTDNPIPKGEDDKLLIENLITFTGKTVTFREDLSGLFVGPKIRVGNPNIESMSYSKLPALNKNNFLSGIQLNIDPEIVSKIDTVISESYQGLFITTYKKSQEGFDINGRFVPLKNGNLEENSSFASTIFEIFSYNGNIKSNRGFIERLELNIQTKSRTVFKAIQLDEAREEKYKVVVKNF